MDAIKAQLLKIQQQLSGLNATQKMLVASLVAIMCITVICWTRYAGTAALEPLYSTTMKPDEAARAQGMLRGANIDYEMSGDQILVSHDKHADALYLMATTDAVPENGNTAEELLKLIQPWDASGRIQLAKDAHLQQHLGDAIRQFFPGVTVADVQLNTKTDVSIGSTTTPTAAVLINTNPGVKTSELVKAVAATVSAAVSGMPASAVKVTVNGKLVSAGDSIANMDASDMDSRVAMIEHKTEEDIKKILPHNSEVSVRATIDADTTTVDSKSFDPKAAFVKPAQQATTSTQSTTSAPQNVEPGAVPNASLSINSPGAGAPINTTTSETETTTNEVFASSTSKHVEHPGGVNCHPVSALIKIPQSSLITIFKRENNTQKDPTIEQFNLVRSEQFKIYHDAVLQKLDAASPDAVQIAVSYDEDLSAPSVTPVVAGTALTSTVGGHSKEIALGGLAAVSLFMVSMMVKKGTPLPALPAPMMETQTGPMTLSGLGDLAGIVNDESSGTLEGVEVGEDTIKNQRVVEQVSAMVKEDPEGAANLVKRWMSHS